MWAAARHPDDRTETGPDRERPSAGASAILKGIVNTGAGHFRLHPELVDSGGVVDQHAIQEILDANGNIVAEYDVSRYEFHVVHDHWHIDAFAQFEIKSGSPGPTGQVVGGRSIKVTFCLSRLNSGLGVVGDFDRIPVRDGDLRSV